MIFNNVLTEQEIVESLIKEAENERGMIYKSYYDEENDELIIANFYYDSNNVLIEGNINQDDLGIINSKKKKMQSRYIMITGSDESSHGGRMKVSARGKRINRNRKGDYISIFRSNNNTISYIGNLSDIDMDAKEYKIYEDLFIRNEDLIWAIYNNRGVFGNSVDSAMIYDETMRGAGYIVKRDRNTGDATIYAPDGSIFAKKTIKGWDIS